MSIFHWHKWEFLRQDTRPENKDVCIIYEKVNRFRCVKCQKEVWQLVDDPYCAFDCWGNRYKTIQKALIKQ